MNRRRAIISGLLGAAALAAGGASWAAFAAELSRARARVAQRAKQYDSRFGRMQYATAGEGPPCLMIHGTGGGFDQGLAFARPLISAGRRVIAPSRFGYLGSANPPDPSPANQADAFADLLNELGIERIAVIGGSAGALSALQFAIRHPTRCAALVAIVPATYSPGLSPQQPGAFGEAIMNYGLRSDFLFWAGMQLAEDRMIATLLASDPALFHAAPPEERARVRSILRDILPVSARAEGLINDARQAGAPEPMAIETIKAPTLAISLEDDGFDTAAGARHIVKTVPGARLILYPTGGHIWIGRDREMFEEIGRFMG